MTDSITITRIGVPGDVVPDVELLPDEDLLPGGFDAQGNPYRLAPETSESPGWYVSGFDGGGEEAETFGESDVMQIRIYNRSVVDIRPTDSVTIRGRVWKVVGAIEPWVSPFSSFAGTAVTLERAG